MTSDQLDVLVVGAGIAGMYQLHRLRELGFSVRAVDAAPDVGGTWYWNAYPGARVDSPANVYQYWFSQELLDEWEWSERFPGQPEIKRYLKHVAEKFDLYRDIELNTQVESASWLEEEQCWQVVLAGGRIYRPRYLVSCVGMLSSPKIPEFPGREGFAGEIFHTARWPQHPVDFAGKRVGVIGTGATGIQIVQTLASEAEELFVFQRTPQYAVRMRNHPVDAQVMQEWRAQYPTLKNQVHETFAGFEWHVPEPGWAPTLSAEQRLAILEECWADGSLKMFVGTYPEVLADPEINAEVTEFVRAKISAQIDDPEVAERLVPSDYGYGLYRVPLENGYFEAFNRKNVHLVDVKREPIESYSKAGLIVRGKEYPLDALIFATGFDAGTGGLARMNVTGRDGRSLSELWSKDIRTTLGLQVHGFPNLFTVGGPLAPSTAFCNMTTCLQQQVDWITDAVVYLRDQHKHTMEPTAEREEEWVQHHDEVANSTLLLSVNSWYVGGNIEGKPRRLLSYIGGVGVYRDLCDEIKANNYPGFVLA
ncbi:MAG: NAD(P)/FAD-dependent oxidoreductase [Pseudomonadota bacterium]